MLSNRAFVAYVVLAALSLVLGLVLLCTDIHRLFRIKNKWLQAIQCTASVVFCLCMVSVIVILVEWHQGKIRRYSS